MIRTWGPPASFQGGASRKFEYRFMFKPFKDIFIDFRRVVGLYVETQMARHIKITMIFFYISVLFFSILTFIKKPWRVGICLAPPHRRP